MIEVSFRHRQGEFALDVDFRSSARVVSLFGPSGSGKTTVLNVIAGLVKPADARVVVAGRILTDTATRLFVPPHRRRIGYVFQEGRLFPHLSVRRNLLYGRAFLARARRSVSPREVIDLLGLDPLVDRMPANLSGGERQRVAIGRALMAEPALLLMDEPLASVDEGRKAELLPYIERLTAGLRTPIVYVSHIAAEIERLAAFIVHMECGASIPPAGDI